MTDLISRADAIEAVASADETNGTVKVFSGFEVIDILKALPSADAEPKRVLQGYNKGANTIQTIRHEELKKIANTRKAVESADAVQGEWIITDTDDGYGGESPHLICSVCKTEPLAWSSKRFFNFCPNCGARMKGGAE